MAELKKCPFCGGEAILTPFAHDHNIYQIGCMDKSCIAHYIYLPMGKEKAIKAWNNRVTEAEIRAKVIDEFAEKIRDWQKEVYTNDRYVGELDFLFKHIYEIAEQLKGE